MPRLTVFSRFLLTLLLVGGIGYLIYNFVPGIKKMGNNSIPESPTMGGNTNRNHNSGTNNDGNNTNSTNNATHSSDTDNKVARTNTGGGETGAFTFTPQAPENGKLMGVVELGASGFNSFIINKDQNKNWKLERAEFGNSLVTENMATEQDISMGLKKYIGGMLDFGVSGKNIHFVVSSGAVKSEGTQKIIKALKGLNYFVNTVTAEQEGKLGLRVAQPKGYESNSFVADIGSGNTKISYMIGGQPASLESHGAKYYEKGTSSDVVYNEIVAKAKQVPPSARKTCFIIGGVPSDLAKQVRNGKERYTVLKAPADYEVKGEKQKAGLNIYKGLADATGCKEFVFDWDANFTIGFLLGL
jgi:hypothetical protein